MAANIWVKNTLCARDPLWFQNVLECLSLEADVIQVRTVGIAEHVRVLRIDMQNIVGIACAFNSLVEGLPQPQRVEIAKLVCE